MGGFAHTCICCGIQVPADPARKGAGLVLKYVVDGAAEAVPSGQTPQDAGFEAARGFAQYLAVKTLHLDVWDGDSLLQVREVRNVVAWTCRHSAKTFAFLALTVRD